MESEEVVVDVGYGDIGALTFDFYSTVFPLDTVARVQLRINIDKVFSYLGY